MTGEGRDREQPLVARISNFGKSVALDVIARRMAHKETGFNALLPLALIVTSFLSSTR